MQRQSGTWRHTQCHFATNLSLRSLFLPNLAQNSLACVALSLCGLGGSCGGNWCLWGAQNSGAQKLLLAQAHLSQRCSETSQCQRSNLGLLHAKSVLCPSPFNDYYFFSVNFSIHMLWIRMLLNSGDCPLVQAILSPLSHTLPLLNLMLGYHIG